MSAEETPTGAPEQAPPAASRAGGKKARAQHPRRARLSLGVAPFVATLVVMVMTVGAGIYQVYSQYQVIRMGYAIDDELFEVRRQTETEKRLRLSIATYKHPDVVQAFATEELEMKQPTPRDEFLVPDPTRGRISVGGSHSSERSLRELTPPAGNLPSGEEEDKR